MRRAPGFSWGLFSFRPLSQDLFDAAVVAEPTAGTYTTVDVTIYKRADSDVSAFDLG